MPRHRERAPEIPVGPGGGEAASFSEDGDGTPPARRLWWIPAIRGAMISLAHPDFREDLERKARTNGLIPRSFA